MTEEAIAPQPGFQEAFLSSEADIVIGGGAAGAGKTFALLLESIRHVETNGKFGAVIFRRTYPQITMQGGLWDTAKELYPYLNGKPNENDCEWTFPSGASIKFNHLQHEKNTLDYQGAQIPLICFDELTHFSESMFLYLLSRNRSTCGIVPYVRATCNPDPESWVARFIDWWIDDDGFPIPERAGVIRYFTQDGDKYVWGDSKQEVIKKIPHVIASLKAGIDPTTLIKSVTFIPGDIYGNEVLMTKNPEYLASLLMQDEETQMRLLRGNWKVKTGGDFMIDYAKIRDAFTNSYVKEGGKYITADIALHGSDRFIVIAWSGLRVIDINVMPKSDGSEVEKAIKDMAFKHHVPFSQIAYDADGVGAFLKGYLGAAKPFNNGAAPIKIAGEKENFKNLKSQCFYKLAAVINKAEIFFAEDVANVKIDSKFVRELVVEESRAIKRNKPDADGKLAVIPKEQMKNILGRSPDFMDALMMRMYFMLKPVSYGAPKIRSSHAHA